MADLHPEPTVGIGMPVYNGERFLRAALDSIAAQTFASFELVISDNGSTDRTQEICQEYARSDARIRYCRSEVNRGASWNFNRVVELSHGRYFKWAAHDDVLHPSFLERCVEALEADESVALAFSGVALIDEAGDRIRLKWRQVRAEQDSVVARYRSILGTTNDNPEAIFGVFRRSALDATRGMGTYAAADHRLLCEVALQGRLVEVPEILFFNRDHPDRSIRSIPEPRRRAGWFDPSLTSRIGLPTWRLGLDYLTAPAQASIDRATRWRCWTHYPWFLWKARRSLARDLVVLARSTVGRGGR